MTAATDQDRARQIEEILGSVDSLPTLSVIATRLLQIANTDDADLDQIVEVIESDPPLTAKLLGLCRRADKGLGDRITTVRRAVVMLGLEAVQAAILSVAVYEVLESAAPRLDPPSPGAPEAAFDRVGFWKHSIAVGSACELIAEAHPAQGVRPEEAFVAGLLHDLGKMVLDVILPRSYARVLGLAERRAASSADAELQLLGLDHHTVGKRLAEHWGLPAPLRDAMWLHGQPPVSLPEGTDRALVGIVGVARTLCRHLHLGWSGDFNHPEPLDGPRGLCSLYSLSPQSVESVVPRLHDNIAHRCRVLGLAQTSTPELLAQAIAGANRRLGRLTSIYEQRSRVAARQTKALTAIAEFHAACAARADRSILDTLAEVVRSASAVMGPGFFGVVYQLRAGDPWQLSRFSPEGRPTTSQIIDAPPGHAEGWQAGGGGVASLAALTNPAQLSMGAMSLLPWLSDYLLDAGDLRNVQLLSLTMGQAAVVLLHDRQAIADKTILAALTASWGAAIAAVAHQESSRRAGERLAAATRSLAEAQQRLAESESLARLGEMAAGAAHEMNNPLTVISGRAQLLSMSSLGAADRAAADAIVDASRNLSDLITSLRLLADPPAPRPAPVPLDELLRQAVANAAQRADAARVTIDAPPTPVPVDRDLIATALGEIVLNALQASDQGPVSLRASTSAEGTLLIEVRDQGRGMSPRALKHAFDPFFSERPAGRATGLGLTRARRLAELHAGAIAFDSEPGRGTLCTLRIPLERSSSTPLGPKTTPELRAAA